MKYIWVLSFFILVLSVASLGKEKDVSEFKQSTIYQFKMVDIDGNTFDFNSLRNKVVLIVNVASKCGFTSQYSGLQQLYQNYKDDGLVILGIPSNDFGRQEPGSATDIKQFCSMNYNVSFPLLEKSIVIGKEATPLYRFLTDKKIHPKTGGKISWNFNKFLIDKSGYVSSRFSSFTKPKSKKIIREIERLLKEKDVEE